MCNRQQGLSIRLLDVLSDIAMTMELLYIVTKGRSNHSPLIKESKHCWFCAGLPTEICYLLCWTSHGNILFIVLGCQYFLVFLV